MTNDREKQTEGNVRSLCPCETGAENPGPHIPTCPWSDPDYSPPGLLEGMAEAAAAAFGVDVSEVQAVDPRSVFGAPSTVLEKLVGPERAAQVMTGGEPVVLVNSWGKPWGEDPGDGLSVPWPEFEAMARAADEATAKLTLPQRMVGMHRGALEEAKAALDAGEVVILGGGARAPETAGQVVVPSPPPACSWVKIAGTSEQVRCTLNAHDEETDHVWSSKLEPRYPLAAMAPTGRPVITEEDAARIATGRPWFLSLSGQQFFYDAPEAYTYTIEEIAHALSHVCRFVGHLAEFYSVGEHSIHVATLVEQVLLEGAGVTKRGGTGLLSFKAASLEAQAWIGAACRAALLHDASEAFLTDLPRPLKRLPGLEAYRVLEDRTQLAILATWGLARMHDDPVVKAADARLLATEKRDLRNSHGYQDADARVDFAPWSVVPLGSAQACRTAFVETWKYYGGEV